MDGLDLKFQNLKFSSNFQWIHIKKRKGRGGWLAVIRLDITKSLSRNPGGGGGGGGGVGAGWKRGFASCGISRVKKKEIRLDITKSLSRKVGLHYLY
jgi:hypothetical protein